MATCGANETPLFPRRPARVDFVRPSSGNSQQNPAAFYTDGHAFALMDCDNSHASLRHYLTRWPSLVGLIGRAFSYDTVELFPRRTRLRHFEVFTATTRSGYR
jgi:hypothetical protein